VAYVSLSSGNIGHTPASSPTFWESVGSSGVGDPGANGVMKRTALNTTAAALADDLSAPVYAAASSGTNAIVATMSPNITAYVTGTRYRIRAFGSNTGQTTINLNGLGAILIKKMVAGIQLDMVAGDIVVGQMLELTYDGSVMQLLSPSQWSTSGTNVTYTAGNIGIGETSPSALLALKKAFGTTEASVTIMANTASATTSALQWQHYTGAESGAIKVLANTAATFATSLSFEINTGGGAIEAARLSNTGVFLKLLTFASNSAAISGGLSAGTLYTDGAGSVKVVF
jgi:hypothetical protein